MARKAHENLANEDASAEPSCISFLVAVRKEHIGVMTGTCPGYFYVFFRDTSIQQLFQIGLPEIKISLAVCRTIPDHVLFGPEDLFDLRDYFLADLIAARSYRGSNTHKNILCRATEVLLHGSYSGLSNKPDCALPASMGYPNYSL